MPRLVALSRLSVLLLLVLLATTSLRAEDRLWDVSRLLSTPTVANFGKQDGLVQAITYPSEPYQGRPTEVFAYLGRPEGKGPFPAMLLVHGGGGKAFAEWAKLWAERGYVSLAMDLAGNGPDGKRLEAGGPPQDDGSKFRTFTDADAKDMWTYQAVAAILRGHALLSQLPEVDKNRIGITGISWGGYLTCIVAGIDDQLKVAVPVYGCGFLGHNSCWNDGDASLARMAAGDRERWLEHFDPSQYLPGVKCPILFVNGTNDFAYPLDSYQKSYRLVTQVTPRLCVTVRMPHGHPQGWAPKEIGAFVDSVLKEGEPLITLGPLTVQGESTVQTTVTSSVPPVKAEFQYTTDTGRWQSRNWKTIPAKIAADQKAIVAELPGERPLTGFITAVDDRGLTVSSEHIELPGK